MSWQHYDWISAVAIATLFLPLPDIVTTGHGSMVIPKCKGYQKTWMCVDGLLFMQLGLLWRSCVAVVWKVWSKLCWCCRSPCRGFIVHAVACRSNVALCTHLLSHTPVVTHSPYHVALCTHLFTHSLHHVTLLAHTHTHTQSSQLQTGYFARS